MQNLVRFPLKALFSMQRDKSLPVCISAPKNRKAGKTRQHNDFAP